MMLISRLPEDLMLLIANYLTKKSLSECTKVCRLWYAIFSPIYNRTIILWSNSLDSFLTHAEELRIDGTVLGNHAKSLRLLFHRDELQKTAMYEIFRILPRIKILRVDRRFVYLLQTVPLDRLKNIEEIAIDESSDYLEDVKAYLQVIYRFKNQITTLTIPRLLRLQEDEWQPYFLEVLPELVNLKAVKSVNLFNYYVNHGIDLASVLSVHKSMTEIQLGLDLKLYPPLTDTYWHLKSLFLKIPNFTKDHAAYIMRHLPNLQVLGLWIKHDDFHGSIQTMSPKEMNDFARYLGNTKDVIINQLEADAHREGMSIDENQKFWDFIGSFCGVSEHCCVNITLNESLNSINYLEKKGNRLVVVADQMQSALLNTLHQIDYVIFEEVRVHGIPIDQSTEIYLQMIKSLIQFLNIQLDRGALRSLQITSSCKTSYLLFGRHCFFHGPNDGVLKGTLVTGDLLISLCRMFPQTDYLCLQSCMYECVDNVYSIDLRQFENLRYFRFDVKSLCSNTKRGLLIYIQFIDITNPSLFDVYCYDSKGKHGLQHLGNKLNMSKKASLIKIQYKQLEKPIFFDSQDNPTEIDLKREIK